MQQAAASLTTGGAIALAITAIALVLFIWNRLRVDVVALIVMLLLILSGVATPQQGISGFAHEATITVALVLVLAAGLLRTGAVDVLARWTARLAGRSELRLLSLTLLIVVPLSALINNTAAVGVMIPMVLGLARSSEVAPSRLLMPMSFAAQLGGTLTLIGTSTNLLVAGVALDLGLPRISLFDITLPALIVCAAGLLYIFTIGRWLLPHRTAEDDLLRSYELHDYLTMLRVRPGSRLVDRSLAESRFGHALGLQVVRVVHHDGTIEAPSGGTIIRAGDVLAVEGKIPDIAKIQNEGGLEMADTELALEQAEASVDVRLAEVLVPRRSSVARRTVRDLALRARFGISVVAVRRHGVRLHERTGDVRLQPGDMLLVQGTAESLNRLHQESDLALLGAVDLPEIRVRKMKIAVPIVFGVVLLPAIGVTTILVSGLVGVVLMFLTRCITPDEAYREMDWMVIVLLGAILPLGEAMHRTGAAAYVAGNLMTFASPLGPHGLLAVFLLVTTALTSVISNAAAAVVLAPIAIAGAATLGLSPMPFVIGVMVGASNSFMSPVGYQTNTMIYGPGGYHFGDYMRVGAPLSLVIVIAATFAIPLFFPF
ncbi:MAG TPA: SLC13 family permease [Longimicrobiales bacterium]|nr:SLC13 family permease [Longimicrobiales bacterium]